MLRFPWMLFVFCATVLTAASAVRAHAVVPCESLTSVMLNGGAITVAHVVAAGQFVLPAGGAAEMKDLY